VQIFEVKSRSWDSYVAGIGASGALMASAIVMFVILVGIVTFKTWPHAGGLFGGGGGDVALSGAANPARAPAASSSPNLVKLFGAGGAASPRRGSVDGGGSGGADRGRSPGDGVQGRSETGDDRASQPQAAKPPSSPQQGNIVRDTVSGVGEAVQGNTENLGDTLGGSDSPGLGGVLGGVGRTLNNDLKSLAGE
jgi:hypothetical protein